MKLKDYLVSYRETHKLSQRQLAELCGLSNGYISMLERGENPKTHQPITPTLQKLKMIADGTGRSLTNLLEELDDISCFLDGGLRVADKARNWVSDKAAHIEFSIDTELLRLLELLAKDDSISLEDEIERILYEGIECRVDSETSTTEILQ